MSSFGETTAAAATEAAGLRAVALALLVTVAFSCAFFYMMRWAASTSSYEQRRRSSRHQRGNGDGYTGSTKHKKSTSAVHQRKKNSSGKHARPTSASTAVTATGPISNSPVNSASKNGDKKKRKAVDDVDSAGAVHKTNDVAAAGSDTATDSFISSGDRNRWTRRQRQQEQSRSGGDSSPNSADYNSGTITSTTTDNEGHRRRSSSWSSHSHIDEDHMVVDDPIAATDDQDQGEWITMVTYTIIHSLHIF